jgi:transcriptional regulator with XRE-family HTH domain
MTQVELSETSGVSQSTISGYVNGNNPSNAKYKQRVLDAIQDTLGYSDDELLNIALKEIESQAIDKQILNPGPSGLDVENVLGSIIPGLSNITDPIKEHIEVVRRFKNKPLVLIANQLLLAQEEKDQARFGELIGIIRKFVNGAEFIEAPPGSKAGRKAPEPSPEKRKSGTEDK